MKRKILSFICIALTLCMLLSSCGAGGALQPPFLKLLGGAVSGFFGNAKNLLKGNEPLILSGTVNYRLDSDGSCPEAEAAMLAAIREKTGYDLASNTDASAPRLRVGLDLVPSVTAASYYIGFVEKDLVITAASDVMLTEALRYFTNELVMSERANCGAGYLYVEGDLAYTSETIQLIDKNGSPLYSVGYAQNADKSTFAAVTQLIGDIKSITGVNLTIQDSYFQSEASAETKEILIGLTSREESIEATNALDRSTYYIGIQGNKIIITAKNSFLLQKAVQRFSELFVTHEKAAASYEAHTLSLPKSFSHTQSEHILLLSQSSASDYSLIYPNGSDERLVAAVRDFRFRLYRLTGASIPMFVDTESGEGAHEILIGKTNRHASALSSVRLGDAHWAVSTAGEKLVVSGGAVNPLCKALDALLTELITYAEQQNTKDKDDPHAPLPLLCLPGDFNMQGTHAPDMPSLTGYTEIGEGAYMLYRTNCNAEDYNAYIGTLTACGYTYHDGRTAGNVTSATYYSDSEILNVSFTPTDNTLRVCADPRTEAALQPLTASPYNGRTDIEPLFIQVGGLYTQADCGMSYVIRLCDGTFVVVDGGWNADSIASDLLNILQDYNKLNSVPVISCWIFTHGHRDHIGNFYDRFTRNYSQKVDLKSVLYSFPTEEQTMIHGGSYVNHMQNDFRDAVAHYRDNTTIYKARTGQKLRFAGCEIDVLFTFEDHVQPKELTYFNDSSIVFRLSLSKGDGSDTQSFMMLGDATVTTAGILVARYGNQLKSDAVQVAHHGYDGGTDAVYNAISAAVVFWPCPIKKPNGSTKNTFSDSKWSQVTRRMLANDYAKILYVAGKGTSAVNLTHMKNRTIADTIAGMNAADAAN